MTTDSFRASKRAPRAAWHGKRTKGTWACATRNPSHAPLRHVADIEHSTIAGTEQLELVLHGAVCSNTRPAYAQSMSEGRMLGLGALSTLCAEPPDDGGVPVHDPGIVH